MHKRTWRERASEWFWRYLPGEIIGTTAELSAAAGVYLLTGSLVAAAIAATAGGTLGYYATNYWRSWRVYRVQGRGVVGSIGLALRSIVIEFGPGEIIDTLAVRPAAFYLCPILFGHHAGGALTAWSLVGWVVAKLLADTVFYAFVIISYEINKDRVAHYPEPQQGAHNGHTVSPVVGTSTRADRAAAELG